MNFIASWEDFVDSCDVGIISKSVIVSRHSYQNGPHSGRRSIKVKVSISFVLLRVKCILQLYGREF